MQARQIKGLFKGPIRFWLDETCLKKVPSLQRRSVRFFRVPWVALQENKQNKLLFRGSPSLFATPLGLRNTKFNLLCRGSPWLFGAKQSSISRPANGARQRGLCCNSAKPLGYLPHSFQGSFFQTNLHTPKRNSRFFSKRTMVDKNGQRLKP